MRLMFDIEFNLDMLILVLCSMYATKKILDVLSNTEPRKMREPEEINLDSDSEHEVNSDEI